MTGISLLVAEARGAGVRIAVDGDDLVLTAPVQPPAAIVDKLARHKAELIALLQSRADDWTIGDWQAYFDERAAIAEYDGGFTRAEAEARALDCCDVEWLRHHPVHGSSEHCLGCGDVAGADATLLVFGDDPQGAWLHSRCWPAWSARRGAQARSALAAIGIGAPGQLAG